MKKIGYVLLVAMFAFLVGCNVRTSTNKDKEITGNKLEQDASKDTVSLKEDLAKELLPTVDSRIIDLLEETKILQVPLVYSFEDEFNINSMDNSQPLSDEMLSLLSVAEIDHWIDDFSGIVWLSCRVNLSKDFKTLIFSISTGGEATNVLVNYSNSFEFIHSKDIAYEDYVEGYYNLKSLIDIDKIIQYKSSHFALQVDTVYFRIDEHGVIDSLHIEKDVSIEVSEGTEVYEEIHESIQDYEALENILETEKFRIRIDRLENGDYRYASWSANQKMLEQPDLILTNGEYIREGTGGNHSYEFANGVYKYRCSIHKLRAYEEPPAALLVYKDDEQILYQPAQVIK